MGVALGIVALDGTTESLQVGGASMLGILVLVGKKLGLSDGEEVKLLDGTTVGLTVGFLEEIRVGIFVDGEALGLNEGVALRILVGQTDG